MIVVYACGLAVYYPVEARVDNIPASNHTLRDANHHHHKSVVKFANDLNAISNANHVVTASHIKSLGSVLSPGKTKRNSVASSVAVVPSISVLKGEQFSTSENATTTTTGEDSEEAAERNVKRKKRPSVARSENEVEFSFPPKE